MALRSPKVTTRRKPPSPRETKNEGIREQLERVVTSVTFRQVDRLKRFLTFTVGEAIAGRADQLKEYVIGVQVFDKEQSFDPRADPIVRVQARRLRTRLMRYYEGSPGPKLVIELPKGGYAPTFAARGELAPNDRRRASSGNTRRPSVRRSSAAGDLGFFCQSLRQRSSLVRRSIAACSLESGRRQSANDPRQAVAMLHAALVVSGSVRSSGATLRVTTHIIDGASGSYLWSETLDLETPNFTGQEAVAQAAVNKLKVSASGGTSVRGRRPTENLAARNLYLQGRYHMNQRTEEGLRKAVEFFERAIVEDSQYALAHSGLADGYGLLTHYGVFGPADVWTKAASSATTAVMLDPDSAEARTSLAHVKSTQDWDWHGAEREFQLAISLNPAYATANHWYAMSCLVPLGRSDEALDEMLTAQSLDPVSSIVARDLALVHLFRRDLEAALEQCDHAIELNAHFSPAYWALGLVQEQRKDVDEAAAAFQRAIHLSPDTPRMQAGLARTLALAGKRKEAMEILRRLEALSGRRYVSPFEFASMRFALDQTDLAFRWFNKACQDRSFELLWMRVDPRPIPSGDKRFEAAPTRWDRLRLLRVQGAGAQRCRGAQGAKC